MMSNLKAAAVDKTTLSRNLDKRLLTRNHSV